MATKASIQIAVQIIKEKVGDFTPRVGIILGSGLGPLADDIQDAHIIPYQEIPGMPVSTVQGHAGQLVLGYLNGLPVACLKGRVHYYEGASNNDFKMMVRLLKELGCHGLIITNASGSLRRQIGPGELVLVNDHINFQHINPLLGKNDNEFGDRFFPMDDAYDKLMREKLHETAQSLGIALHDGVYISVLGPNFETPAEIRAFRILGADVVGMSTVPEVIVARHCGLRVVVISTVTNLAADISEEQITHEGTLHYTNLASGKLRHLVSTFLMRHGNEI